MADEKVETAVEVVETPATMETAKDVETVQAAEEVADTPEVTEEAPEGDEVAVEAAPEATPDPILFDIDADDVTVTVEKANKVLEQYELPEDVQNAINALTAKANSTPAAELSVYGDTDAVKQSLERHNLLFSVEEVDGSFRPKTDKFIAELSAIDPEKTDWLYYDISNVPSQYTVNGRTLNKFEASMIDYFAPVGSSVAEYVHRIEDIKEYMNQGVPQGDLPTFVPKNLRQAYYSLEAASRADIEALESNDEYGEPLYTDNDKQRKVRELASIQRGLDSDRLEAQRFANQQANDRAVFNTKVVETQNIAFAGVRDAFAASLKNEVKFSDDPKVQTLLCNQQVTTLIQALQPDSDGDFARKTLAEANIKFDLPKAQAIIKEIETTSVELTLIQAQVDENGVQMNKVELNKAAKRFEDAIRKFQGFGEDIIRQEKQIAAAGTKETVDKAVEKRKLELKTRPALKASTTGVKQQKSTGDKPPSTIAPFSPEWDAWYADKEMARRGK